MPPMGIWELFVQLFQLQGELLPFSSGNRFEDDPDWLQFWPEDWFMKDQAAAAEKTKIPGSVRLPPSMEVLYTAQFSTSATIRRIGLQQWRS